MLTLTVNQDAIRRDHPYVSDVAIGAFSDTVKRIGAQCVGHYAELRKAVKAYHNAPSERGGGIRFSTGPIASDLGILISTQQDLAYEYLLASTRLCLGIPKNEPVDLISILEVVESKTS